MCKGTFSNVPADMLGTKVQIRNRVFVVRLSYVTTENICTNEHRKSRPDCMDAQAEVGLGCLYIT